MLTLSGVAAIVLPIVGSIVWLVRLEGRVNTHEAECRLRQKRLDERHDEMSAELRAINTKLDWLVERRYDQS